MSFDYVIQREEKTKVCFGSGLERKTLESDKKGNVSRHARKYMTESFQTSPGMYDITLLKSAFSSQMNKPISKLGTVLGGRKSERIFYDLKENPGPGEYNLPTLFNKEVTKFCTPFTLTNKKKMKTSETPGVGTYKVDMYKRRRLKFKHSFGGKKCLQPPVKTKCGAFNFDKCERCQNFPEGDYWYLEMVAEEEKAKPEGIFLCRPCYDIEKKENKMFNFGQMQRFKKIRDCSKIHFHDGCKGKLFLVPPKEILKLEKREAYLNLYFS